MGELWSQSISTIDNRSVDGAPLYPALACSNVWGASLILHPRLVGVNDPPNRPARPPHQLALSLFFFAASLGGRSDPAPEPYFSHMFGANFNWLNANCWREFSNGLSSAPPVWVGVTGRPNLSAPPDTRRRRGSAQCSDECSVGVVMCFSV